MSNMLDETNKVLITNYGKLTSFSHLLITRIKIISYCFCDIPADTTSNAIISLQR